MVERTFTQESGEGPLIATAIHDGHALWPEVAALVAISDERRLREEDPYTARFSTIAPTRIVATHSRFQCDFNRPRELAIYRTPEQAWGLRVWNAPLPDSLIARMSAQHDEYYRALRVICDEKVEAYGRFVLLDMHSYNHRRDGADTEYADPVDHPDINLGTGSMPVRWQKWVECFEAALARERVRGQSLDVRDNVIFRGGYQAAWVHRHYPDSGFAIAIEVKKIFIDEWTGVVDDETTSEITAALGRAARALSEAL